MIFVPPQRTPDIQVVSLPLLNRSILEETSLRQTTQHLLLWLFLVFLIGIMVLCGYLLHQELQKPDVMEQYDYDEIQELVTPAPQETPEEGPQYDAEAMQAINPDFLGWLYIPDTNINLPVTAGTDNDWYLTHSFSREYSVFGCPFLDIHTPVGSRNRVIHGHNMGSQRTEMFSRLLDYQDPAYAKAHKQLYFSEPEGEGNLYEVFAVLNFNLSLLEICNYIQPDFESEESFQEFVAYLQKHSLYETDFLPTGDTLILSTCNRAYGEDNRLLICAGKLSSPAK